MLPLPLIAARNVPIIVAEMPSWMPFTTSSVRRVVVMAVGVARRGAQRAVDLAPGRLIVSDIRGISPLAKNMIFSVGLEGSQV